MNKDDQLIRLSGIIYESLVNGPGMRRVFFSQGCSHNCKGCFNTHTHSFNGGELFNINELVNDIVNNPMIKGITFSGGDPFEQSEAFSILAKQLKDHHYNIWSYSGYTFEEILSISEEKKSFKELLNNIDVLVDGLFVEDLKDTSLKFRGSSNQRIIDVKKSLELNKVVDITSIY